MSKLPSLLERLSALHRSLIRKFASDHEIQAIHVEILVYLNTCNRYSDSALSLGEYLGLTKGSLSQSIALLVQKKFIRKQQDEKDKRLFHLRLTEKSKNIVADFNESLNFNFGSEEINEASLVKALAALQAKNEMRSFGLCSTCRFNESKGDSDFRCGLTGESLTSQDTRLKCREHKPLASRSRESR